MDRANSYPHCRSGLVSSLVLKGADYFQRLLIPWVHG